MAWGANSFQCHAHGAPGRTGTRHFSSAVVLAYETACVQELDAKFAQYEQSVNPAERQKLAEDIQRSILENLYFVPIFRHAFMNAIGPRIAAQKWQDVFPTITTGYAFPGRRSSSRVSLSGAPGEGHGVKQKVLPCPPRQIRPNTPSMHLDNPLDQGQADACAVAGAIQALEETKDLLVIAWCNPYAIIADITDGLLGIPPHAEVDTRLRLGTHEFHGIIQQVLQHFEQSWAIPTTTGKSGAMWTCTPRAVICPLTSVTAS